MRTLEKLTIENFKSIRKAELELGSLNIFIGGNGAGKSNLIGSFKLLEAVVQTEDALHHTQELALRMGGAESILHFGRKNSDYLRIGVDYVQQGQKSTYLATFFPTGDDSLYAQIENGLYLRGESSTYAQGVPVEELDRLHPRSALRSFTSSFRRFHFHDTSDSAKVKLTGDLDDNRVLRPHAENLAAFLYWMQEKEPLHFHRVQETIRQVAPFFDRFDLAPSRLNEDKIRLEWKEVGSDSYFNASALSDGTLRFICLATLLLQPELPPLIIIDEPELGLHPAAIQILASMLSAASTKSQVIVATQSVTLVDQFGPEVVWAVDREDGQSVFRRLSEQDMSDWLEEYSLGELWEKNVLGARP